MPVAVPPVLDKGGLDYYRELVEQRMLHATDEAERWAEGRQRRGWATVPPLAKAA